MDDPAAMEHAERFDDGDGNAQRVGSRNRTVRQARRERLAVDQLHRDERLVVPLAQLEDLTDQRMRDAGAIRASRTSRRRAL
jgi:hypothetical protein